ncbi:MAG: hypothetical protein WCG08_02985 [Paludibacter sp.]
MNNSLNLLKSDFSTILDLLFKAKKQVVISIPNISIEIAESLVTIKSNGIDVNIFLEFSENTYRNGYGDIQAIEILQKANINIQNKNGFNIYFYLIDDFGYFYFPKSSYHEKEGDAYDLFPIQSSQIIQIKFLLNLLENENEMIDIFDKMDIVQIEEISKNINPINQEVIKQLEVKLANDPPLKPNYARTLEVYKAKFQYVDLKFTGANLHTAKVKLPPNALPFKDNNLKNTIEANLKLFSNLSEKEFLNDFFSIKERIKNFRNQYLIHIKIRDKSIIQRDEKADFEKNIKLIENEILDTKKNILNKLQGEINNSRKSIEKSLFDFLLSNPPESAKNLFGEVLADNITYEVSKIVSRIKFPEASSLIDDMKLDLFYYDITWEDLNNKDFLIEMQEKNLLSNKEKAYFDNLAIEAKKDN